MLVDSRILFVGPAMSMPASGLCRIVLSVMVEVMYYSVARGLLSFHVAYLPVPLFPFLLTVCCLSLLWEGRGTYRQ